MSAPQTSRAASAHSATKSAAFEAVSLGFFEPAQQTVMDVFPTITEALTREEIAERTSMKLSTVCGRVNELMARGWLVERGSKKGGSGRQQQMVGLPRKSQ